MLILYRAPRFLGGVCFCINPLLRLQKGLMRFGSRSSKLKVGRDPLNFWPCDFALRPYGSLPLEGADHKSARAMSSRKQTSNSLVVG